MIYVVRNPDKLEWLARTDRLSKANAAGSSSCRSS
jgi:hypothetical protein